MSERIEEERLLQSLEGFEKLIATADATTFVSATRKIRYCDILKETRRKIESLYARIEALEEARTPRLLTLDEITKHDGPVYVTWQDPESGCWVVCPPKEDIYRYREWDTLSFPGGPVNQPKMKYGKTWRCWTQQPTKEQREAVPWDE